MDGVLIYYSQERSGLVRHTGLGLLHIFCGQGVGKTSRAVGLAIRAAGHGLMVDFVQFMKSGHSGEVAIFRKIPEIRYRCPGEHPFIMSKGPQFIHYEHAEKALAYSLEAPKRGTQLLICDEILDTLLFKLLGEDRLIEVVDSCRGKIELILTGREAPANLIRFADYVTELVQIKHPYYSGARAREGIEY